MTRKREFRCEMAGVTKPSVIPDIGYRGSIRNEDLILKTSVAVVKHRPCFDRLSTNGI
jgi:hypothetical protein